MGLWRGYYPSIPHGNVYIFAASMAALLYLYRNSGANNDSIFRIIKFVAGPYEAKDYVHNEMRDASHRRDEHNSRKSKLISKSNIFMDSLGAYQRLISWIKSFGSHQCCPHRHSCAHFVLGVSKKMRIFALCKINKINLSFFDDFCFCKMAQ